jgi:ABC-type uncharacterized transport system substrate-binding protein
MASRGLCTVQPREIVGVRINRRALLAALACLSVAAACTTVPRDSPPPPSRSSRLGLLTAFARADNDDTLNGFVERIGELGWHVGRNLIMEERWSEGRRDIMLPLAQELVRMHVDVILAPGTVAVQAAKQATSTIPVVMTNLASDPVENGLVASLAKPGGNITGLGTATPLLTAKRLEFLAELVPGLRRVAVMVTPDNPSKAQNVAMLRFAAGRIGVDVRVEDVDISMPARAFESARTWSAQALLVIGDAALGSVKSTVLGLSQGLPTVVLDQTWVTAGGLMSYSEDSVEDWRRAAEYVDSILRGRQPSDLPVEVPSRFHLAVNATTAQQLGIRIPPDFGAQVTEWVQ